MFFGLLTLFTALSMATVAAVFAIYGIIAIFAGMPQFALVMGAVIELGKVVGISWLYRNWNEPTKIKYAMAPLVLVAMMLTSMGIFGLLSKAHLEQTSPVANNEIQIERLDQQIAREQSKITDAEQVISQLDQSVQALINFDRIRGPDGALAVRESQAEQRELLRQSIDTAQTEVDRLEDQKLELSQALRAIELEVGPVKYLAELVYGSETDRTEEAVRWVIIAFIFVFDPMAILLLMAANYTLDNRKKKELPKEIVKKELLVVHPPMPEVTEPVTEPQEPVIPETVSAVEPEVVKHVVTEESVEETKEELVDEIKEELVEETKEEPAEEIEEVVTEAVEPEVQQEPSAVDDAAQVIAESAAKKKLQDKEIITEGVTPVRDVGGGYVEYNRHLFQKDALKEIKPDLFRLSPNDRPSSNFGTQFPKIAKNKDIFVRVDMMPNRVYRFNGDRWIEVNKDLTESYLYDQEYIRYLVDKLEKKEYDIDLLSEQEKVQIEEYLKSQL